MKSAINRQIVAQCTKSMPKPRIKVAILDTGYDEHADFFTITGRRNRMQGWKDWVDDSLRPEDHDGHGTHVVSLVMKIAPAADIYVARVAKNAAGLQSASKKVAEV
jgi:subtilisin family serine protease